MVVDELGLVRADLVHELLFHLIFENLKLQ